MIARPTLGPLNAWQAPRPTVTTLGNGLTVWAYDLPGQYIATASLILELPINAEPTDGLALVTVRCLDEGTESHPGVSFTEALEGLGGQFHGLVGQSTTQCSIDVPTDHLADCLPLLAEIVSQPELNDETVERVRNNRLAEIDQQLAHGGVLAAHALRRALLADGLRLARPLGGTAESVASVTPTAVRRYRAASYRPDQAVLIIAGDLTGVNLTNAVETALAGWSPAASPTTTPEVPAPGRLGHQMIPRPGAVQTDLRLGWYGIDRSDERWAPLQVALTIMGGSFLSRLNAQLREQRGYTYGVALTPRPFRTGGTIELSSSTRTDAARAMLEETLDILSLPTPFTVAETEAAIGFLAGSVPLSLDTADAIADQAATLAAARLPLNYVDRLLTELSRVTPDQATAAYRALVIPEQTAIVEVGDVSPIRPSPGPPVGHPPQQR